MSARGDGTSDTAALEARLIRFLEEATRKAQVRIASDTPIFETGLFDSLALVKLVLWIEEQSGVPVKPGKVDLRSDFATPAHIVRYVARHRQAEPSPPGARPAR